jgi:hypothetical protein
VTGKHGSILDCGQGAASHATAGFGEPRCHCKWNSVSSVNKVSGPLSPIRYKKRSRRGTGPPGTSIQRDLSQELKVAQQLAGA